MNLSLCFDIAKSVQHPHKIPLTTHWAELHTSAKDFQPKLVACKKVDHRKTGCQLASVSEFVFITCPPIHGFGTVHQKIDSQIILVFSQFDKRVIVTGIYVPIKLPQIIPGNVVPVICKLDTLPAPSRTPIASYGSGFDLLGDKL
jgi:hypothetical protein